MPVDRVATTPAPLADANALARRPAAAAASTMTCEQFYRVTRALADPQRFALLQRLTGGREVPCQELVGAFPVTQATISHHLKELHAAGLITARRDGKCMHLRADRAFVRQYQRELAKRLGLLRTARPTSA